MSDRFRELFLINAEKRDFPSPRGKGEISLGAVPLSRFDSRFVFSTREQGFSKVCSALEKVFSRKRNFLISPRRERSCFSPSKGPFPPPPPPSLFSSLVIFRTILAAILPFATEGIVDWLSSVFHHGYRGVELWKSEFRRKRRRFFASAKLEEGGNAATKSWLFPAKNSALSAGFLADTISQHNFLFSRPRTNLAWDGGCWVANGKGGEEGGREKEKELALMEGGGGRAARSPYSCIVARSIAFSTELNSTQQWRTQWAV